MLTRESLTTDIQALRQQLLQGEFRLYTLQQQLQQQAQANDRLSLTIAISEKFLAQLDAPESVPASNGLGPVPALIPEGVDRGL